MNIKKIMKTAVAAVSTLALASVVSVGANAAKISGSLGYSSAVGSGWSFDETTNTVNIGEGIVDLATGDLAGLIGDNIAAVSFIYDPFVSPETLWTLNDGVTTFEFELTNIDTYIEFGSFLLIDGKGTISAAGFETTNFNWEFTGQSFTFSAGTIEAPEPGTLALLGAGMLALAAARKKAA